MDLGSTQPLTEMSTRNLPGGSLVFCLVSLGGVRLSPLGTSATVGLLYQPRMIDDDYGAVGGMRIGRGNRSTRRKPAPVPLCPPQIPHDLTWDRTRTAAVGSQRLTAWAMPRPFPGGKGRPACDADNLTAICEPIVYKMCESRRLTTLWAFTACYRDSFTFT
jgi:hypothetical protein